MSRNALALASSVALAGLACRTPAPSPVGPASTPAAAHLELAAYVPADTPLAIFVERALIEQPFTMGHDLRKEMADSIAELRQDDDGTPLHTFWAHIAGELGRLDDTSLRNAGWLPGKSELVLYSVGLMPVLRVHVDGPKVEALLGRAAEQAHLPLDRRTWQGKPYLVFDDPESDVSIAVAFHPQQLVVGFARDIESLAAHITGGVPATSLATTWSVGDHDRFALFDPARFAALLADPGAMAQLVPPGESPAERCVHAMAAAFAELPRTTSTVAADARSFEMDFAFDLSADTAALFRGSSTPGWPAVEHDVPTFRMSFGAPPLPLFRHAAQLLERSSEALEACGEHVDVPGYAAMVAQMTPLDLVQSGAWEMAALEGDEITVTLALGVRDVGALWSLIAGVAPMMGRTVPAIGEIRDLPMMGTPAKIGVGRNLVVGAIGSQAERRVRQVVSAKEGPRLPVASHIDATFMEGFRLGRFTFMGRPMADDTPDDDVFPGDLIIDSRLEGRRLVVRSALVKGH